MTNRNGTAGHGEEENFSGSEEELATVIADGALMKAKEQMAAEILVAAKALNDLAKKYLVDVDADSDLSDQEDDIVTLKEAVWDYIVLNSPRERRGKRT
jgi:hypothetical protein